MNKKKKLVTSISSGYSPDTIVPFIKTLQHTGYDGEICIFVNREDNETIKFLQDMKINVEIFTEPVLKIPLLKNKTNIFKFLNPHYKYLYPVRKIIHAIFSGLNLNLVRNVKFSRKIKINLAYLLTTIMSYRFLLFGKYLEKNRYDYVMIADIRDVIFQKDPFDFEINNKIISFSESKIIPLELSEINKNWILNAYGEKIYNEMKCHPVICAGVTIGNYGSMLRYLNSMIEEIIKITPLNGYILGIDQGLHNYIFRYSNNNEVKSNFEGPVLTLASDSLDQIKFNNDGLLVNKDNSIINVVHQYDRHDELLLHFKKLFDF